MNTQPELTDEQVSALMDKYRVDINQMKSDITIPHDPNTEEFINCNKCGRLISEYESYMEFDLGLLCEICKTCKFTIKRNWMGAMKEAVKIDDMVCNIKPHHIIIKPNV